MTTGYFNAQLLHPQRRTMPRSFLVKKYFAKQKPNYSELECQNSELRSCLSLQWIMKASLHKRRKWGMKLSLFLTVEVKFKSNVRTFSKCVLSGPTTNQSIPRSSWDPLDALYPPSCTQTELHSCYKPLWIRGRKRPQSLPMALTLFSVNHEEKGKKTEKNAEPKSVRKRIHAVHENR